MWKRHTEYNLEEIPVVRLENLNDIRRANHYFKYEIDTSNKGNNKITELRTILQRESQNS